MAAARTAVFTLSVDLDHHCIDAADITFAMEEIADAIARRCTDLPYTRSDAQVDRQEVQVSAVLDRRI